MTEEENYHYKRLYTSPLWDMVKHLPHNSLARAEYQKLRSQTFWLTVVNSLLLLAVSGAVILLLLGFVIVRWADIP